MFIYCVIIPLIGVEETFTMHNIEIGERHNTEGGERVSEKCGVWRGTEGFHCVECRRIVNVFIAQIFEG